MLVMSRLVTTDKALPIKATVPNGSMSKQPYKIILDSGTTIKLLEKNNWETDGNDTQQVVG